MVRAAATTKHINGHIFHFFPETYLLKSDAETVAEHLRRKGARVRMFHVYSSWNRRKQYELFTFPKVKWTAGGR